MHGLLKYAADKFGTKKHVVPVPHQDQDNVAEAVPDQVQDKDAGAVPSQNKDAGGVQGQPAKKKRRDYLTTGCIRTLLKNNTDKKIKAELDDEMAARLFCMEVLDKLLVSSSISTIPTTVRDAVTDLDKLKHVGWCTLVYEKLKTGITDWKKNESSKNRNLTGCIYLLLVSILVSFLVLYREPII
jgi:hypothetical protein